MPVKEPVERGFATLQEEPDHEGEEPHQEQEQHNEHKRDRRSEIAADFPFGNGLNISPTVHCASPSLAVSGLVMLRNTSSKRPSSVCNSSIFHPSLMLISATWRASSPFLFGVAG